MVVENKIDPSKLKVPKPKKTLVESAKKQKEPTHPTPVAVVSKSIPELFVETHPVILAQDNCPYIILNNGGNDYVEKLGTRGGNKAIVQFGKRHHIKLKKGDIADINEFLHAYAEDKGEYRFVSTRIAQLENGNGFVIDLCDGKHTHLYVYPGSYELKRDGSDVLFQRSPTMRELPCPTQEGNYKKLDRYLNLSAPEKVILRGYLTYTLAHAKSSTTNYVILVIQGDQGTGKSYLNKIIKLLIDPSSVIIMALPRNEKDLAIAAQNNHVICLDNIRNIKTWLSDLFCMTSTGGMSVSRQLYKDTDQTILNLHVALILNGIHDFIDQPDLAERVLCMRMKPLGANTRISEAEMTQQFMDDYPEIFTGLIELTANILEELPEATPVVSERMIDFVHWLAAMERAEGVPEGVYQNEYARLLNETQLDSLMDDPVAAAIIDYFEREPEDELSGTPSDVLQTLTRTVSKRIQHWHRWPRNAISFSKRLQSLKAGLKSQGIVVDFERGKYRKLSIQNIHQGDNHDE